MKIAITGTTKGIGKALKEEFEKSGYTVIEINRNIYDFEKPISMCDINLENIEVLINNAGHELGLGKSYEEMMADDILSQVNVNLLVPMLLTHTYVKQNKSGTIINITSGIVDDLRENSTTYYTTKCGLSKFTKAARQDLKDKFRFIEVRPRRINTDFHKTSKASHTRNSNFLIEPIEVAKIILDIANNPYISDITIKDHRR